MGSKGIGEIGIVGTAAAIANAVHHATGVRHRTLPIRLDREFGDYLNHDLAQYHFAACADILDVDAIWIDEADEHLNPIGA